MTVDGSGNVTRYDGGVYPADLSAIYLAKGGNACLSAFFLAEGMQLGGRSANYGSANEKYPANRSGISHTTLNKWRNAPWRQRRSFTGKERDAETGYDYPATQRRDVVPYVNQIKYLIGEN
jgi:hypothetical protein